MQSSSCVLHGLGGADDVASKPRIPSRSVPIPSENEETVKGHDFSNVPRAVPASSYRCSHRCWLTPRGLAELAFAPSTPSNTMALCAKPMLRLLCYKPKSISPGDAPYLDPSSLLAALDPQLLGQDGSESLPSNAAIAAPSA